METAPRSLRYELKMPVEQIHLPFVRTWVQLHSAGFREVYPPRRVNNLYFDTLGLDSFNDHIEGVPERRKLRLRWYGENLGMACGQLEIKNKRERVGWKLVQPVDALLDLECRDWVELQNMMYAGLSGAENPVFLEMLRVSHPFVMNTYQREYYLSADDRFRLTLDFNQAAYDQWFSAWPNLHFALPLTDEMVIEFKCEVQYSRDLADILAEFPLRVSRNSKYVTAMDSLLER